MIGVSNDRVYKRFCTAMERPDWATDARFVTNVLRAKNRAALDSQIQTRFLTAGVAHWTAVFDTHDVPVSPIQTAEQVLADPQVVALGQLQQVDLPGDDHASAMIPRLPFSLSVNAPAIAGPPPRLGEHGRDILRDAGYTETQIEELLSADELAAAAPQDK
jgi:crotonobetainyl-CoA:carnitine CoA-transferase CaiB-like acyl-CoA transferase